VKQNNFNSRGFSLIEVLVAIGLVGVIMTALMSMTDIMNANNKRLNMVLSRNDIVNNIRTQSMVYSNIDASALMTNTNGVAGNRANNGPPNNLAHFDMLAKCLPSITDPLLVGCNKTTLDDPSRGNRFYLANHDSLDINQSIAGEDVYYRQSGIRCSAADAATPERCPLFARTWAEPFCLNFRTSCNKAMSVTIRYSVGLRPDYPPGFILPQADGEIYLPLQKGIQITRVMDQTNGTLTQNLAGIYPVQKYLGFADQAGRPQGLRFEVVVGNPTGLVSMKIQSRSYTGALAAGLDENSIPPALESLAWNDVINPATGSGAWTITLAGAVPSQFFNFGLMTTASSTSGLVPSNFAIGSANPNDVKFHWTIDPGNPANFIPPTFKSGFYQFRVVATDVGGGTIESTNYATIRIIPRPEIRQTSPATNPFSIQRNCTVNNNLDLKFLIGDDEGLTSNTARINGTPVAVSSISGTHGEVIIPFDLQQTAGPYTVLSTIQDFFSNKLVMGVSSPETTQSLIVNLQEVTPVISPITSSPNKIRINTSAILSESYSTGSCCTQTPSVNWTFPTVPAAPGIMLSGALTSAMSCSIDVPTNSRICTGTNTVNGIKEGPTTASADVQTQLIIQNPISPACSISSGNYSQSAYIQVVSIPGIYFYTNESLWLDFSNLSNETGLMTLAPTRQAWIKADFDPDSTVSVKVVKATDLSTSICTASFSAGTSTAQVLRPCPLPAGYSGDYILLKNSANVQGEADLPDVAFRARLVSGQTVHRACLAQFSSLPGQQATKSLTVNYNMWNSPFNATEVPAGSGSTALGQDPKNDAGYWTAGATKKLRCYDRWASYNDSLNNQDRRVIKAYLDAAPPTVNTHKNWNFSYSQFVFPNTVGPDFSYADNTNSPGSPNAPTVFLVTTGPASSLTWSFVGANSATTPPQPWIDRTNELCTGGASLYQTKLYSSKMVGHNSSTTNMKATNRLAAGTPEGYSYVFMCNYGRWNPSGAGSTSWVD
jgi:prepilin-type N-terminal cleavage/methylation domain-containing protein